MLEGKKARFVLEENPHRVYYPNGNLLGHFLLELIPFSSCLSAVVHIDLDLKSKRVA